MQRRNALKKLLLSLLDAEPSVAQKDIRYPSVGRSVVPEFQDGDKLRSCLCTAEERESVAFRCWVSALHRPWELHLKPWDFGFVCQALCERGLLEEGRKTLGFAVGEEPLPALCASRCCSMVATELETNRPTRTDLG